MYLQELFNNLAYGEFSGLAIGNASTGTVPADKYPKLVSLINIGLLDLHTRFTLIEKEFDLYQRDGIYTYYLRSAHVGDPAAGNPELYVDGTSADPIAGDIIKIIKAFDEDGNKVRINDARYPDDIFMPQADVVKMTLGDPLKVYSLVYQASYPTIVIAPGFDPATYELLYPRFLNNALMAFVAARLNQGRMTQANEGQNHVANTFFYRYEQECKKIESLSLVPMVDEEAEQFYNNGWV
jgi:hypothetical protein